MRRQGFPERLHAERIVDEETHVADSRLELLRNGDIWLSESQHERSEGQTTHQQDQQVAQLVAGARLFLDLAQEAHIAEEDLLVPPEIEQMDDHRHCQRSQRPEKLRIQKLHRARR